MAVGDITSSVTEYASMAALEVGLEAENTGAATAGADTTTFLVIPDPTRGGVFYLVKIARAAA